MGLIEQRFGLGDKRRIFVVRAPWRSTVDRRRGDRGYGRRRTTFRQNGQAPSGYEVLDWDRQAPNAAAASATDTFNSCKRSAISSPRMRGFCVCVYLGRFK
jgi:hypothetical protein